jgi:hypothetical protein
MAIARKIFACMLFAQYPNFSPSRAKNALGSLFIACRLLLADLMCSAWQTLNLIWVMWMAAPLAHLQLSFGNGLLSISRDERDLV